MGSSGRGFGGGLKPGPLNIGGRRREGLSPHARQQVSEAHQLRSGGKFGEAATAFAHLAGKMSERGEHVIALHAQIEAARALTAGGQADEAVAAGAVAAGLAVHAQRPHKASRSFSRLVSELRSAGHTEAADAVDAEARAKLGVAELPAVEAGPTVNRAMRRSLPKTCPTCGLPASADRLEFSEDGLADCGWCGSTISA